MVMMLPFLTGMASVWFGITGRRTMCLWLWALTLAIFAAWCGVHMTDPLSLSL
jgi:hypothetical protein